MKHLLNILFFVCTFNNINAQLIEVNTFSSRNSNPDFSAASGTMLYSLVQGNYNAETGMYDSLFFGDGAINMMSELDLTNIRFPGGTLSQFYHFRGQNGYGTTDEDLFCRPGYLPLGTFYTKVSNDDKYPENMIHQYIKMIKTLEAKQNRTIGTFYVINIMTHFFNGDFFDINPYIDELIVLHGNSISHLLDKNPSELTDDDVNEIVSVMVNVTNDPIIISLMEYLTEQTAFQEHFTENIEAIQFLIDNGVTIKGIELGNENYAYKMLHDDDLSHTPFDCTTPDSVLIQYTNHFLPVEAYMQGMIKYAMITSMYDQVISDLWGIETGIVVNGIDYGVDVIDIDSFEILNYEGEKGRYFQIWNKYIGQLDTYDAIIPHIYLKNLPHCEIFDALSLDSLEMFIKNRIDFYFNDIITWQLDQISEDTKDKPIWITEWNINGANAFGNTFAHATHSYKYLNEVNNHLQFKYNIEHLNFHLIISWTFNQFALMRAEPTPQQTYGVSKQAMFHAFEYMKTMHQEETPIAYSNYSYWLNINEDDTNQSFWAYLNEENTQYYLNYVNQSEENIEIILDSLILNIYRDSIFQENKMVTSYQHQYFDAESILSSNLGCEAYPEIFTSYEIVDIESETGTTSEKMITIPPISFGTIQMNLENVVTTSLLNQKTPDFKVYPNPTSELIHVKWLNHQNNYSVQILDVAGKIQVEEIAQTSQLKINVESFSDGIYILQLKNKQNEIVGSKKFIVSHK